MSHAMRMSFVMALALAVAVTGSAQTAKRPAFEVASIRPSTPGTRAAQRVTGGRVEFVSTNLRSLVMMAFSVKASQLSAPDWLGRTAFDIHATMPAGGTRAQVPDMLRTLLVERFGLVTRVEQRPVEAYELVVGKGSLTMREVEAVDELDKKFESDPPATSASDVTSETLDGPVRTMMVPLGMRRVTSRSMYVTWTTANRTFIVEAARIAMPEFAEILTMNVDRPVFDKTGLSGLYEFKVELDGNASALRGLRSAGITTTVRGTPLDEPTGVSTPKAVEGLGLKLEERRVPMDFVVVERIEAMPTEN